MRAGSCFPFFLFGLWRGREGTLGFGFVRKEGELSKESERERFLFLSGE